MERMRDVLRGSLRRSLSAMQEEDRLAAAWPVACGRAMAEHGEIVEFAEGVLRVRVTDAAWLGQMRAMRGVLTAELGKIAGVKLSEIHFELRQ